MPKTPAGEKLLKILAVDDEEIILDIYRNIFSADQLKTPLFAELDQVVFSLFDNAERDFTNIGSFGLDVSRQAEEAVNMVQNGLELGQPYFAVFLDVRMPPGKDGIWAAQQIRQMDQRINIVIVTAYSDIHPQEIAARLGSYKHFLYIQKPFCLEEVYQLALSLSENWLMQKQLSTINLELEKRVARKTADLLLINKRLQEEIRERIELEERLRTKSKKLQEMNTALNLLLDKREKDREAADEKILHNLSLQVEPYIEKLLESGMSEKQRFYIDMIKKGHTEITSSFSQKLTSPAFNLTSAEIQVANFIKSGKTTKEIAGILNLSERTIETHRKNIRKKMGLKQKKISLRSSLL
ncbi:MAG: response regulator transcription factor, partial [Desulfobulbales bacterium]|nr:response regulator transcription factor [Desulfobulbales bacterium]